MRHIFTGALVALLASPALATDPQFGAIRVEIAPNVRHAFVSAQAQSSNSSIVSRNEWNAAHTVPAALVLSVPTGLVWPAQPAAVTEFCGASTSYRWRADLTNATSIRLTAQVISAGAASSALRLQYTTDTTGATGWDYLDGSAGPSVSIAASGVAVSSSVTLATAAKADVLLRLVGINGDGAGGAACYSGIKAATATLADSATTATTATAATALAADGANCSTGQFPLGVDASGASQSCTSLPTTITGTANQIAASASTGGITLSIPTNPTLPGTTTGTFSGNLTGNVTGNASGSSGSTTGNAATATALAANGANCSAGNYPLGVDASGAVESCTAVSSGTPGGSNTYVQYNNAGSFGGAANLTNNGTTVTSTGGSNGGVPAVSIANNTVSGSATGVVGLKVASLPGASGDYGNTALWATSNTGTAGWSAGAISQCTSGAKCFGIVGGSNGGTTQVGGYFTLNDVSGLTGLHVDSGTKMALVADSYGVSGSYILGLYSAGTMRFRVADTGSIEISRTVTAGGTTGAQTINKTAGTVNFAAAATSLVVTNSLVTTSSIIFTTMRTADTTCTFVQSVVPAAGSFTITVNAGCNAETSVGFLVAN